MRALYKTLGRIFTDQHGTSAMEYAFIAGIISIAAIFAMESIGGTVNNQFSAVESGLHSPN